MAILTKRQVESLRGAPLGTSANKLKIAFAYANTSRSHACEATGLAAPTVSKLISGSYINLDIENARKLADYFGCAIEDLFPSREAVAS